MDTSLPAAAAPAKSDITRIVDALVALTKALPGAAKAHLTIGIHGCETAGLRALVTVGAKQLTYTSDDGDTEWDAATLYLDGYQVTVTAFSPHRPIVTSEPIDSVAVEAALAQAAEVL